MLRAIADRLVVEPYYDADKIGSIYIPEAFKNPEPQQGVVKSVGPASTIRDGAYILFHPFRSSALGDTGLISIADRDVVAYLIDEELVPREEYVMVLPDWATKYEQKGLIYVPPTARHDLVEPVMYGTILRSGCFLPVGEMVVIPPSKGSEIGFKDTVYYFIHQDEVLATVQWQ